MKTTVQCLLLVAGLLAAFHANTGEIFFIHTDAFGNVIMETDKDRNVVWRREYEPYGLPSDPSLTGPGYTGHVHDADTGLIYMQQRYYDPVIGRFLSVDPVATRELGDNFNRYWYANNNPYRYVDRDGREAGFAYELNGGMHHYYSDNPLDPTAAALVVDFTPGIGDIKGFVEAYNDPSIGAFVVATVGLVPVVGDAGKALIRSADDLIEGAGKLERLKGGDRQGHVKGDTQAIFDKITEDGEKLAGGRVRMADGTVISTHKSKYTGQDTIQVDKGERIYKIRIEALEK